MWRLIFGKYKEIVAAIAVFLVLDAGVLLLNIYTTYQISDDAHAIQLATRQAMLTQRIFHSTEQMRHDLQNEVSFETSQKHLAAAYKQFDEVFDAFIYGGTLIGQGQGQDDLLLEDSYLELSQEYLVPLEEAWNKYGILASPLVYADFYDEDIDKESLLERNNEVIAYTNEFGDTLLTAVSTFSEAVEGVARQKAVNLRTVQAVAIGLAIINFFIILFHFIKRLNSSDDKAQKAQDETSEIMRTVSDGLFLLDHDYKIGSQYSASMMYLFRKAEFSGENFFELLKGIVSDDVMDVARDYVDSLFNERVKSSLMDELNPLQEVEISLSNKHGITNQFFSFNFSRVYSDGKIIHLLVSVQDVTEVVELRSKLEESNERVRQEAESILSLVSVDPHLLEDFIIVLNRGLSEINQELEKPEYYVSAFVSKLDKIKRIAHSLKGEASMLGLSMVESNMHSLEDKLEELGKKSKLEGDDFLPITIELESLVKTSESIGLFMSRMSSIAMENSQPVAHAESNESQSLALNIALEKLVQKASDDMNKKVTLDLTDFDSTLIPEASMEVMKSVLVQLVRNAMVHGLEKPDERFRQGKSEEGVIKVITKEVGDELLLNVSDDGRGIDFYAIKKYLVEQGRMTVSQVNQMSPRELIRIIFQPGFSTSNQVDKYAGRGVGLDVVKEYIDNIGASLSVSCKSKRSSEFRIRIPIVAATEEMAEIA